MYANSTNLLSYVRAKITWSTLTLALLLYRLMQSPIQWRAPEFVFILGCIFLLLISDR